MNTAISAPANEPPRFPSALRAIAPYRRALVVAFHLLLVGLATYLAFWLRFDGAIPQEQLDLLWRVLPWLVLIRGIAFVPFGVYQGVWRYAGLWELQRLAGAVIFSSFAIYFVTQWWLGPSAYPRSVTFTDPIILLFLAGGVRLSGRLYLQHSAAKGQRRVLVIGAGDAGEMIVRDMKRRRVHEPVGFVDDDRNKVGQFIHGVPVLGRREDLPRLMSDCHPDEVLIAIPSASPAIAREIVYALRPFRVAISTLPNNRDILGGRVTTGQIRSLSIEDLLARAPVGLDARPLQRLIEGRRVMVTGAGGSIGSELCRQIAALRPAALVLYERYENNLFAIANDLADRVSLDGIHPVVGDVTDMARLEAVMTEYRPDVIFHAAAHKHVPLMEANPCEAVKNNVGGTRLLAETAERLGVRQFVFISSDKAVNPTSVMGATKRIAELILQCHSSSSATSFSTVRFGNVLGSNGSVVPRFVEQIEAGGPVTVTHPDIRRFFMLIPEAVQLVLHAASHRTPGLVYVLDMGEQIKLVDLARNLIRLSGFVPDEDIAITFVGLRPGEKLFEELVGPNEVVLPSPTQKVLSVRPRELPDAERLARQASRLERLALRGDAAAVLAMIREIVPEFVPPSDLPTTATFTREPSDGSTKLHTQLPPRSGRHACPGCGSERLSRSHARSLPERIHRSLTSHRLHRCAGCGWRGWAKPVPEGATDWPAGRSSPSDELRLSDYASIDLAVVPRVASRSPFPQRSLD